MQKKVGRRLLATIWTGLFRIIRSTNWNKWESISNTFLWCRFFFSVVFMLFLLWVMSPKKNATPKVIPNPSNSESIHSKKITQPKKTLLHIPFQHLHHQKKHHFHTRWAQKPVISGVMGWPKINYGFHWVWNITIPKKGTPIYNHRLWCPPASSSKSNSSAKSTASKTSPEPALRRPIGFSAASAMTSFTVWKPGPRGGWKRNPGKKGGLWVWSKEYMEKWVILFKVIEFQICSIQLILRIWWWMIESIPYLCTVIWQTFRHWWFNDP